MVLDLIKKARETGAKTLDLRHKKLTSLPAEIFELKQLTRLDLGGNQLTFLPPQIFELKQLTSLYLTGNQLTSLPPQIIELKQLTSLELRGNQLMSLPPQINELNQLTWLDLSVNQLTSLPPQISELKQLEWLDLSENQLTSLPPQIFELKQLTWLNLSGNQLTSLPPQVLSLDLPIKWEFIIRNGIKLTNNPLQSPPVEIVKQGHEAVVAYFAEMAEPHALREVKLLMVGDGGAGKTSLAKRFLHKAYSPDEEQTHGINIDPWTITHPDGGTIKAHIWDFGGQEIMHATHQFFLSHRSLYLLVLDGRRDEKTEYWLKHIESFGGESPVFVVLNKIDQNPAHEVDRAALREKYPQIKGFFRISCAQKKGITPLIEAITELLPQLDMLRTEWPKRWFLVKQALETDAAPYLDFAAYQQLCQDQGMDQERSREVLVQFLHDLGVAIHFPDFDLLDTYILNPLWVTTAVYRIVNNPEIVHAKGILVLGELRAILKKRDKEDFSYPVNKHTYIVNIMKKFELCYSMPDERILVPDLLPIPRPAFSFDRVGALRCRITYEFLPRTVIARFIVKCHKRIDNELRWRGGVVLADEKHEARAVIRADYEDSVIEVLVNGLVKQAFFAEILQTLREINDGFQKNRIREKIACNCEQCKDSDEPEYHDYQKLLRFLAKGNRDWPCQKSEEMVPITLLLGGVLGTEAVELTQILDLIRDLKDKADTPESLAGKVFDKLGSAASIAGAPLIKEIIQLILG